MTTATPKINIETDDLVPLGILAAQRLGKRRSPATLWRWRLHGVNGARLAVVNPADAG